MAVSKPQGWAIVGCVVAVCACLCLAILDGRALIKAQFGVAQREDAKLRDLVNAQANQIEKLLSDQMTGLRTDANAQLTAIRDSAMNTEKDANDRTTEALAKIEEIRGDLKPVLENAASLENHASDTMSGVDKLTKAYAALPARVGAAVAPSWAALEPEITCRHADGSGYGTCWHSRTTALLGEAANVGGVFTQQFPKLAASLTGIAVDAHGWTTKYVAPHPLTTGQKFKAAGEVFIGLGTAALRGGVL
jgi:hypothetical protein